MKRDKILALIEKYDRELSMLNPVEVMEHPPASRQEALGHIRTMVPAMKQLVATGEDDAKLNRWLGFVQGILFSCGARTINDMRDDNRPIFKGSSNAEQRPVRPHPTEAGAAG